MINPKIKEMIIQIINEKDNDLSVSERVDHLSEHLSIYHQELEFQNDELRRIQQTLEKNQKIFQSIFDEAPIGYIITDETGLIHKVNEKIISILHKDYSDFIRHSISSLIAPDSQDKFYFFMKTLDEKDHVERQEISFRSLHQSVPLLVQANRFKDHDRCFIRFALIDLQELQGSKG